MRHSRARTVMITNHGVITMRFKLASTFPKSISFKTPFGDFVADLVLRLTSFLVKPGEYDHDYFARVVESVVDITHDGVSIFDKESIRQLAASDLKAALIARKTRDDGEGKQVDDGYVIDGADWIVSPIAYQLSKLLESSVVADNSKK